MNTSNTPGLMDLYANTQEIHTPVPASKALPALSLTPRLFPIPAGACPAQTPLVSRLRLPPVPQEAPSFLQGVLQPIQEDPNTPQIPPQPYTGRSALLPRTPGPSGRGAGPRTPESSKPGAPGRSQDPQTPKTEAAGPPSPPNLEPPGRPQNPRTPQTWTPLSPWPTPGPLNPPNVEPRSP